MPVADARLVADPMPVADPISDSGGPGAGQATGDGPNASCRAGGTA